MALEALDVQGQPMLHKPFFAGEQSGPQNMALRSDSPAWRDTSQAYITEEHEKANYINTSLLFPLSNKSLIKKHDPSFKALIDSILR
ncbi:MAG: hypothetical protein LBJ41_04570 [Treponema sp.]|jgi:hypothetical protein|nr:hypothetical protein [Treponema sp.]